MHGSAPSAASAQEALAAHMKVCEASKLSSAIGRVWVSRPPPGGWRFLQVHGHGGINFETRR